MTNLLCSRVRFVCIRGVAAFDTIVRIIRQVLQSSKVSRKRNIALFINGYARDEAKPQVHAHPAPPGDVFAGALPCSPHATATTTANATSATQPHSCKRHQRNNPQANIAAANFYKYLHAKTNPNLPATATNYTTRGNVAAIVRCLQICVHSTRQPAVVGVSRGISL